MFCICGQKKVPGTKRGQVNPHDELNRLSSHVSQATSHYQYDAFNRRISKDAGGVVTRYIYDGDEVIGTLPH